MENQKMVNWKEGLEAEAEATAIQYVSRVNL